MSRIQGRPEKMNPLTRFALRRARRKTIQLTGGRATERMSEPMDAYAYIPQVMYNYGLYELACHKAHRVEPRLKELAVLKAATIVNCEFCIDISSLTARRAGLSDEQLLALPRHRESELFSEPEKLVLDYAAAMSRTPARVSDELFAALREHLDDAQLVELTNLIALENLRTRFNVGLGIGSAGFSEGMVCAVPEIEAEHSRAGLAPERAVAREAFSPVS
jgi:AhpD family alkylhydroperoxidase